MKYLNYIIWLMIFAPGVHPQTWRQFYDWDKVPANRLILQNKNKKNKKW